MEVLWAELRAFVGLPPSFEGFLPPTSVQLRMGEVEVGGRRRGLCDDLLKIVDGGFGLIEGQEGDRPRIQEVGFGASRLNGPSYKCDCLVRMPALEGEQPCEVVSAIL